MDDAARLHALYGAPTPAPAAPPPPASRQPAPTTESEIAETLYADGPSDPLAEGQPDADQAVKVHGSTMRSIETAATERFNMSPADARVSSKVWGEVFTEFAVAPADAQALTDIGIAVMAGTIPEQTVDGWAGDARASLRSEFGDRADAALADARKLVDKHPRLKAWLESSGMGNNPKVVMSMARKAAQLRAAGRLTR